MLGFLLPWRRTLIRRRVLVDLVGDDSMQGILYAKRGPLLVLRDVTLLHAGAQTRMDGEVVMERSRVNWYQVIG